MSKVIDVTSTLPSSISYDENVQALSKLFTDELLALAPHVEQLTMLPHLKELPDALLDQLAWHLHVDFYNQQASREEREKLVYQSIAWHRKKGTVGVVEDMVKLIGDEAEIVENWEYNGTPYHFKIQITSNKNYDNTKLQQIRDLVEFVKNVRSKLDGIDIVSLSSVAFFAGGRMATEDVDIPIPYTPNNDVSGEEFTFGTMVYELGDWRS